MWSILGQLIIILLIIATEYKSDGFVYLFLLFCVFSLS